MACRSASWAPPISHTTSTCWEVGASARVCVLKCRCVQRVRDLRCLAHAWEPCGCMPPQLHAELCADDVAAALHSCRWLASLRCRQSLPGAGRAAAHRQFYQGQRAPALHIPRRSGISIGLHPSKHHTLPGCIDLPSALLAGGPLETSLMAPARSLPFASCLALAPCRLCLQPRLAQHARL